jgi:TPR repeat protein
LAADQNHAEAQFLYGICLFTGKGVDVSWVESAQYFKLAADQNHAMAQFLYGIRLGEGHGVEVNLGESVKYLKLAADQNCAGAQLNYGVCLATGRGIEVDLVESARYFKLAADQNLADGQLRYGVSLSEGTGVKVNLVESAKYVKLAADQNHLQAQIYYAACLAEGKGCEVDLTESAKYTKLAADQNNAEAQATYAYCLRNGRGVNTNLIESAKYCKLAADQNLAPAQLYYSRCLADGDGVKVDLIESARYAKMAADQNDCGGQCAYGVCLAEGRGVEVDLVESAKYYKMAADQGHDLAQFFYGVCLAEGRGVQLNLIESARYLKVAADQNLSWAQYEYGRYLAAGKGVTVDLIGSAQYCKLAADQNLASAAFHYGLCLASGEGVGIDCVESARYFRLVTGDYGNLGHDETQSVSDSGFAHPLNPGIAREFCVRGYDFGDGDVLNSLGRCLEFGNHTDRDVYLGVQCYRGAARLGNSTGLVNLGFCLQHGLGVDQNSAEAVDCYECATAKGTGVGSAEYGLCVHYGIGLSEDVESAIDHYGFGMQHTPLHLSVGSFRCLRAMNKLRSHVPRAPVKAKQDSTRRTPIVPLKLRLLIDGLRTFPFGAHRGTKIGVGSSAIVTLVEDRDAGQRIAVKRIVTRRNPDLIVQEVQTLVKLQHPCIVRILGWSPGTDSTDGEIHMEYVPNRSLAEILCSPRKPAPWTRTTIGIIICDIVLGMIYVHSHEILHRDLNPANILLDDTFRAKICDFGLSCATNLEEAPSCDTGTIGYCAPEQLIANSAHTPKADVFSFGVVLYEIISSKRAFPENVLRAFMARLREHYRPSIPDDFGPLMQNLIRRCWSDSPSYRPTFQAIFNEFASAGFEILPKANGSEMREAVLQVMHATSSPNADHEWT